jgi:hypothetical protein
MTSLSISNKSICFMIKKFTFLKVVSLFLMGMFFSFSGFAQVTTSSLSGEVVEPSGEPSIGATVIAKHLPSGSVYSGLTNSSGRYNLANMRVGGPYHVEITFVGYQKAVFDEVYLQLGQPYVINHKFVEEGTSLDELIITSNRNSVLNSDRTGAVTNVTRSQIENLPSISRSVNDLTRLTPQANGTAIGGGNYRSNNFTLDGANFNNQFGIGQNIPAGGSPISLDAIEQISVNITPYDVRQSGFTGAAVNAVTRSGRNEFFGSAFTTYRNESLQGLFVDGQKVQRNEMEIKQYGLSLGGPIIKDKLFFFVNVEQNKTNEPGPSKVAATASNPFGSANNIARPTADFLDNVSSFLKDKYGYETGPYQGYSNKSFNDKFFARVDWNISNKHKLNVRYNQVQSSEPRTVSTSTSGSNVSFAGGNNRLSNNALHFMNSNYFQEANLYSATAEYTGSLGKLNHSLRASWVHQFEPRTSGGGEFPLVDIKDGDAVLTTFGYEPFTFGNLRDVTTYTLNYDASYTLGKHTLTGGLQYETSLTKNGFQRFGTGYYIYDSWDEFANGGKASNYALTFPMTADGSQAFPSFKFGQTSLYLQDEFAVNSRLKLTGGIRLEMPTYPNVEEIKTHPLVAGLNFLNGEKVDTGELPKAAVMVSPRFGFNYDVKGDRSLQIRGGSGVFTGRIPFVWIVAQSGDAGLLQATQVWSGKENTPAFSPDIKANYPAVLPPAGTFIPSSGISAMSKDLKFPTTWKSSLAVDVKLPWGIVATVEGIYNRDLNAVAARNVNLVAPTALNVAGYPDNRPIFPNANVDKYINKLNSAGIPGSGTTGFNTTVMYNDKGGHYASGMLQLTKNFQNGFSGSVSYVAAAAKNFGDGSGDQIINLWSIPFTSSNSNMASLGYTTNVLPHRVVGSVSYNNALIGKLKTGITVFYSGDNQSRYSYSYSSDFNRDGQVNDLIYVPKDASEITFLPIAAGNSAYGGKAFTAEEQSQIFFDLINNDKYLSSRKGQYAERNGAKLPWRNQFDLRITQDILRDIAGTKNGLQIFVDIFNVGNLLNNAWGTYDTSIGNLLTPANTSSLVPGGAVKPTFRLNANNGNIINGKTYRKNESISSTYYLQFGARITFN